MLSSGRTSRKSICMPKLTDTQEEMLARRRSHGGWCLRGGLLLSLVMAPGCHESSRETGGTSSASPQVRPAPAAVAQAHWKGEGFSLSMQPKGNYVAGQPGAVEIVLEATDGYKCNDQYPYKFKAEPTEGVEFGSEVVSGDSVKLEKHRAVVTVPFTAKSAGAQKIAGRFAFSVCTEDRCLVERRELALEINAQ